MPNTFSGTLTDTIGNPISGVKVTITGQGIPNGTSTTTNKGGDWKISITKDIDNKDITVIFSKKGLETRSIKNPSPTEKINAYIDPSIGGTLDLAEFYESGKWKITSLSQENQDIVKQELEDLYKFLQDNPASAIISIEASESQVPNNDNEAGSNINFKTPGSLAKTRAETLAKYVTDFLNEKYKNDPKALPPETRPDLSKLLTTKKIDKVGDEPWISDLSNPRNKEEMERENVTSPANLYRYKKDQYAKLIVETNEKCAWKTQSDPSPAGTFVKTNSKNFTTINFNPAIVPDIFIVEAFDNTGKSYYTQSDTFYQRDDDKSYGDLVTWGLLAYYSKDKTYNPSVIKPWGDSSNEGLDLSKLKTKTISFNEGFNKIFNDMLSEFTEVKDSKGIKGASGTIYFNFNHLLEDRIYANTVVNPNAQESRDLTTEFNTKIDNEYTKKINKNNEKYDDALASLKDKKNTPEYREKLKNYIKANKGIFNPVTITPEQKEKLKQEMKKYIFNNEDTLTYYVVLKELFYAVDFKTNNIKPNTEFKFKGVQGVYAGGSAYQYRVCY